MWRRAMICHAVYDTLCYDVLDVQWMCYGCAMDVLWDVWDVLWDVWDVWDVLHGFWEPTACRHVQSQAWLPQGSW